MVDENRKEPVKPQAKKRRRSQTSPASRKKKEDNVQESIRKTLDPTRTLIVDNGGFTLKYGWSTDESPQILPNITARLKHQFTVLVGDELNQVQNPSSLYANTRSTERGMIVNLGNQILVWKKMLDKLEVEIPHNSDSANAFGWSINSRKRAGVVESVQKKIPSSTIAVLLLLPPHCPRVLLDQIASLWLIDFGVCRIGFAISSVMAAEEHSQWCSSCTIDLGWSSTLVVPSFKKKPVTPAAIRRIPIGARHMINMLKYYMSYRQYNLMEQEVIMREVFESLSFVALDFEHDMKVAQYTPAGRRHYDRDFVLPDYQTSHRGFTRLPLALQTVIEMEPDETEKDQEEDDEGEDEDFNDEGSGGSDDSGGEEDAEANAESEDETEEDKRARLLRERAERERLRQAQEQEEQVLLVSVERFTVPEVLFRPQDAGMQSQLLGLAQAVVQAVTECPEPFQPALYRSIFITGGVSKIPNLKNRLETELRTLVSPDYKICVAISETPIAQGWIGGQAWIKDQSIMKWSIGAESLAATPDKQREICSSLLIPNGGCYI